MRYTYQLVTCEQFNLSLSHRYPCDKEAKRKHNVKEAHIFTQIVDQRKGWHESEIKAGHFVWD